MKYSWLKPRAVLCLTGAAAMLAVLSCDILDSYGGSANLYVVITVQPQGGSGVNTVTCTFSGHADDDEPFSDGRLSEPIKLSSVWYSPHGEYNAQVFTWTMNQESQDHTVSKSAPQGMYLDKDFWVELFWTDDRGDHLLKSEVAECR